MTRQVEAQQQAMDDFIALAEYRDEGLRRDIPRIYARIHAGRTWELLGHDSWESACEAFMPGWQPFRGVDQRREMVAELTAAGLSTRAIGTALGVSRQTVNNDQQESTVQNWTVDEVVGLDGKTRPRRRTPPADPDPEPDPFAGWSKAELDARDRLTAGHVVVVNMSRDAALGPRLWSWATGEGLAVRVDRKTKWGNPFILGDDGDRDTVIGLYRDVYLPHKPSLSDALPELAGKALGCWCHPLPCHGDVLADLA